ncbi:MAG: SUF system NifU family Fe-S cluster assembly protein [Chloroflexi bacterium]|nr:MAG: SUF system NifU family Fe-S cluster assembly protein [Chloroflexota bacterium]
MPDAALEDLYREILLDHYRNPRHHGHLDAANHKADGANPLCGDQITIEATVNADGRIEDIAFSGAGCSISQASSSMMTVYVAGHTTAEALRAVETFQQMMLTGEAPSTAEQDLGDIEALAGVAKFPVRVKCASLAWKTLQQALQSQTAAAVTTDERSE